MEGDGLPSLEGRLVEEIEPDLHLSLPVVTAQEGLDDVVAHTHKGHVVEIDAAEDARHTEHVLALQVRTVTPAVYLHHHAVLARLQVGREFELRHVVGSLGIAHVLAVEPYLRTAVDAAEMHHGALAEPFGRHAEGAGIGTDGIDGIVLATVIEPRTGRNERRGVAVGIFHVAVDGTVIPLHLPAGRHGNGVPSLGRGCLAHGRFVHDTHTLVASCGWFCLEPELPLAVEQLVETALGFRPGSGIVSLVGQHLLLGSIGHEGSGTG